MGLSFFLSVTNGFLRLVDYVLGDNLAHIL